MYHFTVRFIIAAITFVIGVVAVTIRFANRTSPAQVSEIQSRHNKREAQGGRRGCPQFRNVSLSGPDAAWVAVEGDGDVERGLWHTEDGGGHWEKVKAPLGDGFEAVSFINLQQGWAIDEKAQMWRTTDGGLSWMPLVKLRTNDLDSSFMIPVQMKFIDETHGWIIETFHIWRTEDGGVTWQPGEYSLEIEGQPVRGSFLNARKGWVSGISGEIYSTVDGGYSWRKQTIDWTNVTGFYGVQFIDERTGWICGRPGGGIYRTDNGGKTWHQQLTEMGEVYTESISFLSKKVGWAVGARRGKGIALETTDGGNTWKPIDVERNAEPFYHVQFFDSAHGWIFSTNNVYHTNDGGVTWQLVLSLPPIKFPTM